MNDSMVLKIKWMLKEIKESSFKPECVQYISDQQAMGILVSRFFEFEGTSVLESLAFGLTDCNFHQESSEVRGILSNLYELDSVEEHF